VRFVLASASPARLRTLRAAGVAPEVIVSDVDEDTITAARLEAGAGTAELVLALATAKAEAVAVQLAGDVLVLGCDSMLDLDGAALGKPGDVCTARERWRAMRGRTGTLWTGHCLLEAGSGRRAGRAVPTSVRFAEVSDAEIELYCGSGEPLAVAGAFTVDGLGGWFVEAIEGDHHNVVGLSLPTVRTMLTELGHDLTTLGYPGS
jgi:septum formation protein